jgi:hypothetical protein
MAQKPKARKATRKTSQAEKQKEQSARFLEAARKIGVDESGKEFDRALKRITQPNRPSGTRSKSRA